MTMIPKISDKQLNKIMRISTLKNFNKIILYQQSQMNKKDSFKMKDKEILSLMMIHINKITKILININKKDNIQIRKS